MNNKTEESGVAPNTDAGKDDGPNTATWYILRCKSLRESGGLRKQTLAKEANVDRATIDKIEKRMPVTKPTAFRVLNALQKHHATKLKPEKEIIASLRKRP